MQLASTTTKNTSTWESTWQCCTVLLVLEAVMTTGKRWTQDVSGWTSESTLQRQRQREIQASESRPCICAATLQPGSHGVEHVSVLLCLWHVTASRSDYWILTEQTRSARWRNRSSVYSDAAWISAFNDSCALSVLRRLSCCRSTIKTNN